MKLNFKTILIILLPILFLFGISSQEKPWTKEMDKNGISVYLRDYQGSQLKEFKAQTKIKAPIKSILKLLIDFKSYPKWVFGNRNTILFENKNNKDFIYYTLIKSPKPVEDRDLIVEFKIVESSDARCLIKTTTLPKYVNEKPGIVRVKQFTGMWELIKVNETETQVITQCHTEPGGNIPSWLINNFIVTGPYETLDNMKKMLK
jgi:hypothetical protein